jgi:hypothetical protein
MQPFGIGRSPQDIRFNKQDGIFEYFCRRIKPLLLERCWSKIENLRSLFASAIKQNSTTPMTMAKQATTNATFPFMDLPRELRDHVYQFVRNDSLFVIDDGIRRGSTTGRKCEPHVSVVNRLDTGLLLASRQIHAEYEEHASRDVLLLIQGHPSREDQYSLPKHKKLQTIRRVKVILNGFHSGDHALSLLPRWYKTISQGIAEFCRSRTLQIVAPLDLWDLASYPQKTQGIVEAARRFTNVPNLHSLTILLTVVEREVCQNWNVQDKILLSQWTARDQWNHQQNCITLTEASLIACTDNKPFRGSNGSGWLNGGNDVPRYQRDTTTSAARKTETLMKRNSVPSA